MGYQCTCHALNCLKQTKGSEVSLPCAVAIIRYHVTTLISHSFNSLNDGLWPSLGALYRVGLESESVDTVSGSITVNFLNASPPDFNHLSH